MKRILVWLLAACSGGDPGAPVQAQAAEPVDEDEQIVAHFEAMALLVKDKPTCADWAAQVHERWTDEQIRAMTAALRDDARRDAIKAKYGVRLTRAAAAAMPYASKCRDELRGGGR